MEGISYNRASLARKGHTVLLLEAGGDRGSDLLQQMPRLYVLSHDTLIYHSLMVLICLKAHQSPPRTMKCRGDSGSGISATRHRVAGTRNSTISYQTVPCILDSTHQKVRRREFKTSLILTGAATSALLTSRIALERIIPEEPRLVEVPK